MSLVYLLLGWGCGPKQSEPINLPSELKHPTQEVTGNLIQSSPFSPPTQESTSEEEVEMSPVIAGLMKDMEGFSELTWTGDEKKDAELVLTKKYNEMQKITSQSYEVVLQQKNYDEVSAGIYIAGITELRYSDMMLDYPMPSYLSDMGQMLFQERLVHLVARRDPGRDRG